MIENMSWIKICHLFFLNEKLSRIATLQHFTGWKTKTVQFHNIKVSNILYNIDLK